MNMHKFRIIVRLFPLMLLAIALSLGASTAGQQNPPDDFFAIKAIQYTLTPEQQFALVNASQEFNVPVELLYAIGFVESRWQSGSLPTLDGAYGVMGLRDNRSTWTLMEAAALLNLDRAVLERDPAQNIRGAAVLLSQRFSGDDRGDINQWADVVRDYPAFESVVAQNTYIAEVYGTLQTLGYAVHPENLYFAQPASLAPNTTCVSVPADDVVPAHPTNYEAATRPTSHPINSVVMHVVAGSYSGALSWFAREHSPPTSAHYVVSLGGRLGLSVCENDIAFHAGNWDWNTRSIGIEMEGTANVTIFTEAAYQRAAALVRDLSTRYGFPRDRAHIVGHSEISPVKVDPGSTWNWPYFMQLVQGPPSVSNDTSQNATVITSLPFAAEHSVRDATVEASDPNQSCIGSGNPRAFTRSVWFRYTPSVTGLVRFEIPAGHTNQFDSIMSAYTGSPGNWVQVACNDDVGGTDAYRFRSRFDLSMIAGTTYHIMITQWADPSYNPANPYLKLRVEQMSITPPANPTIAVVVPQFPTPVPTSVPPFHLNLPVFTNLDGGGLDWTAESGWQIMVEANFSGSGGLGWQASTGSAQTSALQWNHTISLVGVPKPYLSFASHLTASGSVALVQVRVSGGEWQTLSQISSTEDWHIELVDLSAFVNQTVEIRLVWQGGGNAADRWRVDNVYLFNMPDQSSIQPVIELPGVEQPAVTLEPVAPQ